MKYPKRPGDADFYGWTDFLKWADSQGISWMKGDWEVWWECWKAGYRSALNG